MCALKFSLRMYYMQCNKKMVLYFLYFRSSLGTCNTKKYAGIPRRKGNETLKFDNIRILYPSKETRSPIVAPSGGSKGSTTLWSSFEAQRTYKEITIITDPTRKKNKGKRNSLSHVINYAAYCKKQNTIFKNWQEKKGGLKTHTS